MHHPGWLFWGPRGPFLENQNGFPSIRGKEEGGFLGSCPPQSSSVPMPRYERLEEQLNDLTELHQNEMTNLKQELASMEEKVAYQSYERARDIQVGQRQGSAPRCALHPRHQGGTGHGEGAALFLCQHLPGEVLAGTASQQEAGT